MIKSWKLFLESYMGEEEEDDNLESKLLNLFSMVIEKEDMYREQSEIEEVLQPFFIVLKVGITNRLYGVGEIDKNIVDKLNEFFNVLISKTEDIMIHKSCKEGISFISSKLKVGVSAIRDDEEWKLNNLYNEIEGYPLSDEDNYDKLSQREIEAEIDLALDNKDFDKVSRLSKYLESDDNLKKLADEVIDFIIDFIIDVVKKY
jgi:uncharacterized membrane protein YheB (UPF0754 family)